eukprot:1362837-Amorphochlora_amoeboformis.AAC.1
MESILNIVIFRFPELVAIDAMRKPHNIIFDDKVDKNQKTKDVLIDSLVLASSATLVKVTISQSLSCLLTHFNQLSSCILCPRPTRVGRL